MEILIFNSEKETKSTNLKKKVMTLVLQTKDKNKIK